MQEYHVEKMRFVATSGKVAERHPDRLGTVYGTFFDKSGKNKLSISSKNISHEDARNTDTRIDITAGILVVPAGERGRKPSVSQTQDDINALLNSVRESAN